MRRKVDISTREGRFAIGDRARYTAPQLSLYIHNYDCKMRYRIRWWISGLFHAGVLAYAWLLIHLKVLKSGW